MFNWDFSAKINQASIIQSEEDLARVIENSLDSKKSVELKELSRKYFLSEN